MGDIRELEAIEATIRLYIDGATTGEIAPLKQAFHESARMFGQLGGTNYDVPIGVFFDLAAAEPTGGHRAKIASITQVGDGASVTLIEEGFNGCDYVDFFSLCKIDGEWKIVNKTFVHTGGAPASG
jgi:hypothetical protein